MPCSSENHNHPIKIIHTSYPQLRGRSTYPRTILLIYSLFVFFVLFCPFKFWQLI
jgi:hypothetical protein